MRTAVFSGHCLAVVLRLFICLLTCQLLPLNGTGEEIRPDLDYFPSRLHAAIYRNWDIVPHERVARVLGTDVTRVREQGRAMGLNVPKPLSAEETRRNVELVLRRNWPLMPRDQIEALLGFTAQELEEFLAKEIFLRALLAAPPPGLTRLEFKVPDGATKARVKWYRDRVHKHLNNVRSTKEEPRLAYIAELCRAHNPADRVKGTKPRPGDADLRLKWTIALPEHTSARLQSAAADFAGYLRDIHRAKQPTVTVAAQIASGLKTISLAHVQPFGVEEAYSLKISSNHIEIRSASDNGLARGLVELERRIGERGGPFLAPAAETNRPTFTPRYVSSYFSLMTDVLGQDLIDPFPDGYLGQLFHQDCDGVWVYALLQDLVPSPVFGSLGSGTEARVRRLRDLVNRAARHGLKVFIYLNEPRAQFLPFFNQHPDVKGHVEGNTAALCTSTELVQKHLRGSFERLFREVPGLGGVFVITASENLANCYSHTARPSCPRCSKRSSADVIAESIRCMAEGVWAADPKAKFIAWDWSWHSVLGEHVPEQIIRQLPRGVTLMADFERGTRITRGGVTMNVEEYSISVVGPSPRAETRSGQARQFDLDFMAKIQLSTTWECGTVPFIPVPNLLARKAQAMRNTGVKGTMATWTIGSYPSPNTEAFAVQHWNPLLSESDVLRRVAARRYGADAADHAVRAWGKLSSAFTEEYPFFGSYAPPLQHGPSLPLYRRDIPPPYGNATLFNCKDDWRHWTPPYSPDVMSKLLRHLCERWDAGLEDFQKAASSASGQRRRIVERDYNVAWMFAYTLRAYANALEFYAARDNGNTEAMKRIAAEEILNTTRALQIVRSDSRIGWEAELQYFYRPSDVLERLTSLDSVLEPPPSIAAK